MIYIALLLSIATVHIYANPCFDTTSQHAIASLSSATLELAQHVKDISVRYWYETYYNGNGTTHVTNYRYTSRTDQAENALTDYFNAESDLNTAVLRNAAGDGLIIGLLAGLSSRLLNNKPQVFDRRAIYASIIGSIALILAQNYTAEQTPCFDRLLNQEDNYFDFFSATTFQRLSLAITTALCGCFGGNYIADRIT